MKVDCITEVMEEKKLEGIKKRIEIGKKEGIEKGKKEERIRIALKCIEAKFPLKRVSEALKIPEDELKIEYKKYKQEKTTNKI